MKILKTNLNKGEVTIAVQTADDLWHLSQIMEKGDYIKGKTLRKIQIKGKEERSTEAVKKPIWIKLLVESVEFHKYTNMLRAGGTIVEGPEEVPKAHHTFSFEEGTIATIIKEKWYSYQLKRLREASEKKTGRIIICAFDREEAVFALLKEQGYEILAELKGQVEKKLQKTETRNFYREIIHALQEYDRRYSPEHVILASPSFWKEELLKELNDSKLKQKLVLSACSNVQGGVKEVLNRPELQEVLKQERASMEAQAVEKLFAEISKSGLSAYGSKEVGEAANAGAVKTLLVTDGLIHRTRQQGSFAEIDGLMKSTDRTGGEVFIINSENEPGQKLDALGGIGALLRYKIHW
ncbi:mRNA surveillance protein pelota [Candidatus Woesearchaeota archaeon]|nr:mRNA surveillance protein pelota [Candidatus Woesearchaeota archaeon]